MLALPDVVALDRTNNLGPVIRQMLTEGHLRLTPDAIVYCWAYVIDSEPTENMVLYCNLSPAELLTLENLERTLALIS